MTDNSNEFTENLLYSTTKRASEQDEENTNELSSKRIKRENNPTNVNVVVENSRKRHRTHQMAEDYIHLVGNLMYTGGKLGPYGFDPSIGSFPMEQSTTLGYLTSPLRKPTIVEQWNPFEVALFEACLSKHGKNFYKASKYLGKSKSTKDVIAFYYVWKKTKHYKRWKAEYFFDCSGESGDDDHVGPVKGGRK